MTYKCVIFDFDGTIADTEHHVFDIYNQLAEKYRYKRMSKDDVQGAKNLSFWEFVKSIGVSYIHLPRLLKEGQHLLKGSIETVEPFQDNMKDILLEIKQKVDLMGILTANSTKNVQMFLSNHDLELFDFIESSTFAGKKRKINSLCKKYKLSKEEILYVGDEIRDIHACNDADVKCAVVTWGYNYLETLRAHRPDYIITDLSDLIKIIS
ncbi:HAD-IA family hydrolase [Alkalibaculum bacchi]|uniref:HAD-IA family hydrolase n=1 Tax=Alkalibaculum bacchi TaxID=645887 RepID=UPI0026EB49B8|nr:HAD-IA family hydrolase [Alkalibaculum bacchi]